jgi:hypothetical protein
MTPNNNITVEGNKVANYINCPYETDVYLESAILPLSMMLLNLVYVLADNYLKATTEAFSIKNVSFWFGLVLNSAYSGYRIFNQPNNLYDTKELTINYHGVEKKFTLTNKRVSDAFTFDYINIALQGLKLIGAITGHDFLNVFTASFSGMIYTYQSWCNVMPQHYDL